MYMRTPHLQNRRDYPKCKWSASHKFLRRRNMCMRIRGHIRPYDQLPVYGPRFPLLENGLRPAQTVQVIRCYASDRSENGAPLILRLDSRPVHIDDVLCLGLDDGKQSFFQFLRVHIDR